MLPQVLGECRDARRIHLSLDKVASFAWTLTSEGLDYQEGGAGYSGVLNTYPLLGWDQSALMIANARPTAQEDGASHRARSR